MRKYILIFIIIRIDEVNNDSNVESYCVLCKNIRSDYNCLNTSEITCKIENNVNKEMQ